VVLKELSLGISEGFQTSDQGTVKDLMNYMATGPAALIERYGGSYRAYIRHKRPRRGTILSRLRRRDTIRIRRVTIIDNSFPYHRIDLHPGATPTGTGSVLDHRD